VIRRFYVHNFRCLENFELPVAGLHSVLLIGKNGSGKSTVGLALEVLQNIARGTNRVGSLVKPKDLSRGQVDVPVSFEIQAEINGKTYEYEVAFEFPEGSKELRVLREKFAVNSSPVYTRELAQVTLARDNQGPPCHSTFRIDWHLVALPLVQEQSEADPISICKRWLARLLILRPVPSLISGASTEEILEPVPSLSNFGGWFSKLLAVTPAAYVQIDTYLKEVMPDFQQIRNPFTGTEPRTLEVTFAKDQGQITVPFQDLSDGEKCFMVCALVLAANTAYGPLVCYWDEPDNYVAMDEVGHFLVALRRSFQRGGQLVTTSHNPEAIRKFSPENTLLLYRKSHLEPTIVRRLEELEIAGDLIGALIRGDVEP
jgi:predicted ATPase